ncbi:response regulator [Pseudomonas cerasi]|uniref:response regulator n=1 Tax=Pseudomonas cerasi TaxID=1583341 RepID=UPI0007F9AFE0|nr:response regulator [Pseudomonas cerasi]CZT28017.1 hypothetical protein PCPL58_1561 [Pseudomonas cerasi]
MILNQINLLFIGDEKSLRDNFSKEVEFFNKEGNEFQIISKTVENIELAKLALETSRFDVIVTDLKIEAGNAECSAVEIGNEFIKQLRQISPCPIAILTGKPTDVEQSAIDNASMAKFTKETEAETKIFQWIKTKLKLIALMRQSFLLLNKELAPLFHGGVATRLSVGATSIPAESALRVILENVADSILTVTSTTKCHPQESYIYPVTRSKLMTGDIIEYETETWIILTPACDITRCSTDYSLLLAKCRTHDKYEKYLEKATGGDFTSLNNLINQANNLSTHFLPPLEKGTAPYIVDFEQLTVIKYSSLSSQKIIAAVSPKFLPNLIHRFSAFIGRPGAPDIDSQHCLEYSK